MLVGIGDSFVIFFAVFVFFRVRIGVAATPEIFDEILALFVRHQSIKSPFFLFCNDVSNVVVDPFFISLFELWLDVTNLIGNILAWLVFVTFWRLTKNTDCSDGNN